MLLKGVRGEGDWIEGVDCGASDGDGVGAKTFETVDQ